MEGASKSRRFLKAGGSPLSVEGKENDAAATGLLGWGIWHGTECRGPGQGM